MALPFFYVEDLATKTIDLNEETSKYIITVLRMQKGAAVLLTDGKGLKAQASIIDDNRKRCRVQVNEIVREIQPEPKIIIAISIIKNASRFEWFLEKATEIGVTEIIPLLCERTEKDKFRFDRMNAILVSAMLQSQQAWLPFLHQPAPFETVVKNREHSNRLIAHCRAGQKTSLSTQLRGQPAGSVILIGPEGDFTLNEINLALENNYIPVTLGSTRLRTETAGIVSATLLKLS